MDKGAEADHGDFRLGEGADKLKISKRFLIYPPLTCRAESFAVAHLRFA